MRAVVALALLAAAAPVVGQTLPTPGTEDPRLQTLAMQPGERARLVAFPESGLTLIMPPGERIERAVISDNTAYRVVITGHNDSLSITPLRTGALATLSVETGNGRREYDLETGSGLTAAYVVRVLAPDATHDLDLRQSLLPDLSTMSGTYRFKGDRSLRPQRIADDGFKTYIEWAPEQSLPAVLGIGPTGEEEVVAGHMRDGFFTIDRVYSELVFRIDREKTSAVREVAGRR